MDLSGKYTGWPIPSSPQQLAFFGEFPEVRGLFERWVANCPMAYTCHATPRRKLEAPGTWLLDSSTQFETTREPQW